MTDDSLLWDTTSGFQWCKTSFSNHNWDNNGLWKTMCGKAYRISFRFEMEILISERLLDKRLSFRNKPHSAITLRKTCDAYLRNQSSVSYLRRETFVLRWENISSCCPIRFIIIPTPSTRDSSRSPVFVSFEEFMKEKIDFSYFFLNFSFIKISTIFVRTKFRIYFYLQWDTPQFGSS